MKSLQTAISESKSFTQTQTTLLVLGVAFNSLSILLSLLGFVCEENTAAALFSWNVVVAMLGLGESLVYLWWTLRRGGDQEFKAIQDYMDDLRS